jgi:hypothetical protein
MDKAVSGFLSIVCLIAALTSIANAQTGQFDGITVIELADEVAENAIRGKEDPPSADSGQYIVTFVSNRGSYAALVGRQRGCVAWAAEGSNSGKSISFGLPASAATMRMTPRVCQPFTLSYGDSGLVRVEANNKFDRLEGPLGKNATTLNYKGERKVIAHIPLVAIDWSWPIFSRHTIKNVRLGPLPAVQSAMGAGASVRIAKFGHSGVFQYRKRFEATFADSSESPGKQLNPRRSQVVGHIVAPEMTGWPWDVLYAAWTKESLNPPSTANAFQKAAHDRYGKETLKAGRSTRRPATSFWLYDLSGKRLEERDANPANCLATLDYWLNNPTALIDFKEDVGPWGCALMMTMESDAAAGIANWYRIELVSGYAIAVNHFYSRLEELKDLQQKLRQLESSKPKL